MTGVGLTKTKKELTLINPKKNEKDEMMENINNQINAILKNIDDEGDSKKATKAIKHLKNSADFKNIIEEIDSYTNEIHEEFDEIKYLIKFADNTHKLIDRHKNVMTNIFRGAGLRPSKKIEEERTKNKINDIKKKEKENIKNQENNIRQMLYELNELKKIQSITELTESDNQKFKYIKKDDPCFDNDIQLSKNVSNSQIIKSSKEYNK